MNGLSWLIYGADVVNNLSNFLRVCTVVGAIISVMSFIALGGAAHDGDLNEPYAKFFLKYGIKRVFPTVLFFIVILCFVPTKETIYMIAASQMGEKVYQQPGTQEVIGKLKDTVISELKKLQKDNKN